MSQDSVLRLINRNPKGIDAVDISKRLKLNLATINHTLKKLRNSFEVRYKLSEVISGHTKKYIYYPK